MRFEDFARVHGLLIGSLIPGRWVAVPTEDHPRKRNGRYKWLGDVGWVQNWATMDAPEIWRSDATDYRAPQIRQALQASEAQRLQAAAKAASKAAWIMHQTKVEPHPYLERKGFKDEVGNVWHHDGKALLVIPMRIGAKLVGCQLIDSEGNKKFLYGQQSKGASFVMDAKGIPILCEGYATALSVRAVMQTVKMRYAIHACFSASNLKFVGRQIDGGIVVADRDPNNVGEQAAQDTGKPYWLSDTVGEDFNDYHVRVGLFKSMASLKKVLIAVASGAETSPRSAAPARV